MNTHTVLVVILVLALIGLLPIWGHPWGYGASGFLTVILALVLILLLI